MADLTEGSVGSLSAEAMLLKELYLQNVSDRYWLKLLGAAIDREEERSGERNGYVTNFVLQFTLCSKVEFELKTQQKQQNTHKAHYSENQREAEREREAGRERQAGRER